MVIKKKNNINVIQCRAAILCSSQWFKWYMAIRQMYCTQKLNNFVHLAGIQNAQLHPTARQSF